MKITEKELRNLIKEAIKKKVASLKEGNDFTAKRQIVNAATNSSMTFESDIIKLLDLVAPDELPPDIQRQYYEIVKDMEKGFVEIVSLAVDKLSRFPRNKANGQ